MLRRTKETGADAIEDPASLPTLPGPSALGRRTALLPRSLRRHQPTRTMRRRMRLRPSTEPVLVKKYGNRRLYDTRASRYITLEELETIIRGGDDVRVIDAKTSEDLTQATLAQIILEGRRAGRLLPVPLLMQLIRMDESALAEFMGRYLSATLEMFLEAKRGAQTVSPYLPMATMPFQAANALARMWLGAGQMIAPEPSYTPPRPATPAPERPEASAPDATGLEVAAMRRELDELKASLKGSAATKKRK